jgi:nucleoside-diphosphate-sugar epimerase
VPAVILRLTQTFGPGVRYDDGRVFAEFMRCVLERRDIVLRSPGLTERSYLYTADAVSAILHVLLKGEPGEAYTAANPDTYCSIRDMALLVADSVADGEIQVRYDLREDPAKFGYADTLTMMLDTANIRELGWVPTVSLREMFTRMIAFRREQEGEA